MGKKLAVCLWFDGKAEEAAKFYCSLLPDSRVVSVQRAPTDTPGNKAGDVMFVEFVLAGDAYQGLNGGPIFKFNEAVSISVSCADQAELDRLWEALTADGGRPVQCGWLQDKYGLFWQIVPEAWQRMMRDKDPVKVKRGFEAMLKMVKLDVATLERAFNGG